MDIERQIKVLLAHSGIPQSELARRIGSTPQAFNQRLKAHTLRPSDLARIAEAVGVGYKSVFILEDGTEV